MQRLLRAPDVAQILNVQISTVYSLARRGLIPHVRLNEHSRRPLIRFRRSDVEELLRAKTIADPKSGTEDAR